MTDAAPTFVPPPALDVSGLLVGWSLEHEHARIPPGFSFGGPAYTPAGGFLDPYLYDGEGHLITIAPTGTGKGVSCVIPALLRHEGDVVTMDPKGENYLVTRAARRARGQEVWRLDPFGVIQRISGEAFADEVGAFNPLDLLPYLSEDRPAACLTLARLVYGESFKQDPFWDNAAVTLLSGLIDVYEQAREPWRNLVQLATELGLPMALPDAYPRHQEAPAVAAALEADHPVIGRLSPSDLMRAFDIIDRKDGAHGVQEDHDHDLEDDEIPIKGEVEDRQPIAATVAMAHPDEKRLDRDEIIRRLRAELPVSVAEAESLIDARTTWADAWPKGGFGASRTEVEALLDNLDAESLGVPGDAGSYPLAIVRLLRADTPAAQAAAALVRGAPDKTWGSILTVLQNALAPFAGPGLRRALGPSTIDPERLRDGAGTSLYLVFPPAKLASHAPVIRTIVAGLLAVLASRIGQPPRRTLLLLDEMAQMGRMQEFLTAVTLLRGYGVQVWSFWQDLSQLRALYPAEWQTLVNNSAVFQAFGCATPLMAGELAEIHDVPRGVIFDLEPDEMILSVRGDAPVIVQRPIYFSDPCFDGAWTANPLLADQTPRGAKTPAPDGEDPPRPAIVRRRRRKVRLDGEKTATAAE